MGNSESCYIGGRGSSPNLASNVCALNTLVQADPGAAGVYQSIEVDANSFSDQALVVDIDVTGVGTFDADFGVSILRADATRWKRGLYIQHCIEGIVVNNPTDQSVNVPLFVGFQSVNGADSILVQRATDTASGGNFFRAFNAANNANLAIIDVLGNGFFAGTVTALKFQANAAALPVAAGVLSIGNAISTTASAGGLRRCLRLQLATSA